MRRLQAALAAEAEGCIAAEERALAGAAAQRAGARAHGQPRMQPAASVLRMARGRLPATARITSSPQPRRARPTRLTQGRRPDGLCASPPPPPLLTLSASLSTLPHPQPRRERPKPPDLCTQTRR